MLDQGVRAAILSLRAKGLGIRQIARALQISRGTVRTVLQTGSPMVPRLERAEKAEPHRAQIVELYQQCRGNLVRVHEELVATGVAISYPALTAFCRRSGIGHEPKPPVGQYDFRPGQEMQHDTSPHRASIAGVEQRVETASLVLCYSRMLFCQAYPVFNRFYCKVFLTDALTYLGASAAVCMIDNTHVVVASGTGARMVPAPEMAAFAERFSFTFRAHEKGDANRSARVERPFHFIEHNFLAGRTFADLADLNAQARAWCEKVNATVKDHLHASPRELFAAERPHLQPLPLFIPEVYALHHRLVDVEGYVNVHGHRYSVPYLLISRQLEVRETKDRIDIYQGPRLVASHAKVLGRTVTRVTCPEHRPPRGARPSQQPPAEEQILAQAEPPLPAYAAALKQRVAGRGTLALRRLLTLSREYPSAAVSMLGIFVAVLGLRARSEVVLTPTEELGRELFFDRISQPARSQSCAACHLPEAGWTGGVAGLNVHGSVYRGAARQRFGNRKPPSSAYAAFSPVFHQDPVTGEFAGGNFWDGRATGQRLGNPAADQALGPFLNPVEQNNPTKEAVCQQVFRSRYAALFEQVWGTGSLDCSSRGIELTYDRIGVSIGAYEKSRAVSPFSSKFDAYLQGCLAAGNDLEDCGLAEGEKSFLDPTEILTDKEFDGLIEFGEYCSPCHISHALGPNGEPPLFTDFTFENIGVPKNPENPFYDMDEVFLDDGTPINPLGEAFIDFGLGDFLRTRAEWSHLAALNDGKLKVPTLRNVDSRPGPGFPKAYMHNGVFRTLEAIVHFYNTRDVPAENWPEPEVPWNVNREIFEGVPLGNLQLDPEDEEAIVAFLRTLSDGFTH